MGWPTVFIRLTGCPLRCQYCDTEYAFFGGQWMSFEQIISQVQAYQCPKVTVTGGEPLAQKRCLKLLEQLCDTGLEVSLETSGAIDIASVDQRVSRVVDLKTPGSGEVERNLLQNLRYLTTNDQLKFVICDRADYDWAKAVLSTEKTPKKMSVLMSPSANQLSAQKLADWIIEDRLNVRFQLQMHKYIWGDEPGR